MGKFKAWVLAARLRTLPLSLSGIIVGTALANENGQHDNLIFILALLTTVTFQVTSNFANDYGDGTKGTDNKDRVGPARALQSGLLSSKELKIGVYLFAFISLLLAILLLFVSFGKENAQYFLFFLILALLSIWAAIKYTMGDSPYGYKGFGDFFVFTFFGLVSVLGSEFLYTKTIELISIFPALTVGLLSVGVLNLNNLRDVESDKKHGKNTLIVKMGFNNGKTYHTVLLLSSFVALLIYSIVTNKSWGSFVYLIVFVPIFIHLIKVLRTTNPKNLDPELKKLSLSTFFLAIMLYFSINYWCYAAILL